MFDGITRREWERWERAAIKALCKLDPALHQTEVNN